MRVARVGLLSAIGAALALVTPGAAPAATGAATPAASFKISISPEYTTAGQTTTFRVTVVNTSAPGTTLGSVKVTPPTGFKPPHPAPGTSVRGKTRVQNRTLSLQRVSLRPGRQTRISITAIAPTKCGRTLLHWSSRAFEGATGSGASLALDSALSHLGVTVLCPAAAACGDGGPPCSTSLVTLGSTYAVVSDAASGTLRQTVNVGNRLTCGSYRFRDANWYDSAVVPPTTAPPPTTRRRRRSSTTSPTRSGTQRRRGSGSAWASPTTSRPPRAPRRRRATSPTATRGSSACCRGARPPRLRASRAWRSAPTRTPRRDSMRR